MDWLTTFDEFLAKPDVDGEMKPSSSLESIQTFEAALAQQERVKGVRLPPSYQAFLLRYDGGSVDDEGTGTGKTGRLRILRVCFVWLAVVAGCWFVCPAYAVLPLKILAKQTQTKPHGMSETCYTIGLIGKQKTGTSLSSNPVKVVVWGPTHPGVYVPVPAVYTNQDASLMVIQSMPYWGRTGKMGDGRSLCLIIAMPNQSIKVLKDFSVRLNHLALDNVSRWQNVNGYFHRPASDIFMGNIRGHKIYVSQYTRDPKMGLPEYITLGAEVEPTGELKFLSYTSQGF